jgi:hypothetical protein
LTHRAQLVYARRLAHGLRRPFNTALADGRCEAQTAMRLAALRNASTQMRYLLLAERLEMPEAVLSKLETSGLSYCVPPELLSHRI